MKPDQYYEAFLLLGLLGWLLLYMFLAVQFWFLMLKHGVQLSLFPLKIDVRGAMCLMYKRSYPEDYIKARIYFLGALGVLVLPMVLASVYSV